MLEINDLDDASFAAFNPIVAEVDGLVSRDDDQQLAAVLNNNSSAGVMLFEDTQAQATTSTAPSAQPDLIAQLKQSGALTEDEFQAAKAKLLSS
jgi:hypothetical protein